MSKETPNRTSLSNKKAKARNYTIPSAKEMFYSFRQIPVSEAFVNKLVDDLLEWPLTNPKVPAISEFYFTRGIPERTYYDLINRHPNLKEAHEIAKERLGNRLWMRAVDKGDWAAIKYRLHNYGESFENDAKFNASLAPQANAKADIEVNAQQENGPVRYVRIGIPMDSTNEKKEE